MFAENQSNAEFENQIQELTDEELDDVSGGHDWVSYMNVATAVIALTLALRS